MIRLSIALLSLLLSLSPIAQAKEPPNLREWLQPQKWQRDTAGPVLQLGKPKDFDSVHIFAPCVALEKGMYSLWYCGSQGTVAKRVFQMGLATGKDGKHFTKVKSNPVYSFGNGKHSILTPAILRKPNGSTLRENGKLRLWFSATHFEGGTGLHTLHETSSSNGINWAPPSKPLLEHVYAPTVLKEGGQYVMWYTDVKSSPWVIRHATSPNGRQWTVTNKPVLKVDQKWEKGRLFYPTVLKVDQFYLLWYGSYWSAHSGKTAIGFAVSANGIQWQKHPQNPVFRPDPKRPWESHYTTSQSVLRMPDGSFRIWYASRKKPPFVNKYFAIGTATWPGINKQK